MTFDPPEENLRMTFDPPKEKLHFSLGGSKVIRKEEEPGDEAVAHIVIVSSLTRAKATPIPHCSIARARVGIERRGY